MFVNSGNARVWWPNEKLRAAPFVNLTASGPKGETFKVMVDVATPLAVVDALKAAAERVAADEPTEFNGVVGAGLRESATPLKFTVAVYWEYSHSGVDQGRATRARTKMYAALAGEGCEGGHGGGLQSVRPAHLVHTLLVLQSNWWRTACGTAGPTKQRMASPWLRALRAWQRWGETPSPRRWACPSSTEGCPQTPRALLQAVWPARMFGSLASPSLLLASSSFKTAIKVQPIHATARQSVHHVPPAAAAGCCSCPGDAAAAAGLALRTRVAGRKALTTASWVSM